MDFETIIQVNEKQQKGNRMPFGWPIVNNHLL